MKTTLTGELRAAPDSVTDSTFPSGASILDFSFAKDFPVQTGLMVRQLSDASAFVTLDGTGSTGAVTNAELLVLRASSPVILRITQGTDPVQLLSVNGSGALVLPFDPAKPLTLLEAKGVAKLEYFVAGPK